MKRRESLIICAGKNPTKKTVLQFKDPYCLPKKEIELKNWNIGGEKAKLGSWTEIERFGDFCGTLCYQTEFYIELKDENKLILDMGEVAEQAEVFLNGEYIGYKLWSPYLIDLTAHIKNGKNSLEIKVRNSLANKYGNVKLPSGLTDKVVLKAY